MAKESYCAFLGGQYCCIADLFARVFIMTPPPPWLANPFSEQHLAALAFPFEFASARRHLDLDRIHFTVAKAFALMVSGYMMMSRSKYIF